MKTLRLVLLIIAAFFVHASNEQSTEGTMEDTTGVSAEDTMAPSDGTSTTTAWWTRTFPIIPTRPSRTRGPSVTKVTTSINRVSMGVSIAIPVVLFVLTLAGGFGLIAYAIRTGGNGSPLLTQTV